MVRHIVKNVHASLRYRPLDASLRYRPLGASFSTDVRRAGKNTGKVGHELKGLTGRRSRHAYGKVGRSIGRELKL